MERLLLAPFSMLITGALMIGGCLVASDLSRRSLLMPWARGSLRAAAVSGHG